MAAPLAEATIAAIHRAARRRLTEAGVATPELDARLLLEWATGLPRLAVLSDPARQVPAQTAERVDAAVARRTAGEPVHRIIGAREFYGLSFDLTPDTLEPRPDTETLVDLALPFLRERIEQRGVADLLDLGTGTGAIAIALLSQLGKLGAVGVDIAPGALAAARANAAKAGVSRRFAAVESDWFAAVRGRFDLVISNPPYISTQEVARLPIEVRCHDPIAALDGGSDGLDAYRVLANQSAAHLHDGGAVIVEIGHRQKLDVSGLFESEGFRLDRVAKDLAGSERALMFRHAGTAFGGG
jgi:release factor glutamine methyltransferase